MNGFEQGNNKFGFGCCISLYEFARAAIPKVGWLTLQEFTFSQLWRLEVQDQGVSRFDFSRGLSPWLTDGCLLTGPHMVFPLCPSLVSLCVPKFPLPTRTPVRLDKS